MEARNQPMPALKSLGGIRRRAVSLSSEALVRMDPLFAEGELPLVVRPAVPGVDILHWVKMNRTLLEEKLLHAGGILFRGFQLYAPQDLEQFIQGMCGESLEYSERSSPRSAVSGNIYTSTDYPPSHPIFLHNENSYQAQWPLKIFFLCCQPAQEGGATPIADCRRVLRFIDPEVRERFAQKGWMYVRNFGDGFGLSWQTVFQTEERAKVEEHCARSGILVEWKEGNRLRSRAIRPALARHPLTGETLWFNHATFFHVSTLEPDIRSALLAEFGESELPTNTFFGDGTPIPSEILDHLREAYRRATVSFPWEKGDLLMLDNMLVAHGREPFTGARQILVGMGQAVTREQARANCRE
ncbi:MAG TPA: TauD/TfdA family dioxygenase [Thermoanaerobaculia bacterium]|jgi:alpha-ketoglutarate-dependent taurine dioxygenase